MAKQQPLKEQSGTKYLVAQEFRDKANFETIHEVGKDVSHFEQSRIAALIELGLVKKA